jgi:hypothetical protein
MLFQSLHMLSNLPQLDRMRQSVLRSNPKTISTCVPTVINLKHQATKPQFGERERARPQQSRLPCECYAGKLGNEAA